MSRPCFWVAQSRREGEGEGKSGRVGEWESGRVGDFFLLTTYLFLLTIAVLRKMRYVVGLQPFWFQWLYNLSVIPHLFEKGYISLFLLTISFFLLPDE
ncbi:MAG: hypothetical protein EAZ39_20645 [Oscillatoriales cyanobacterium]|nr:MAG: hypothetical protein EAZ49_08415 [Oscillatoriales cyanobacterium]TAG06515.1 MAG: hypothetical protein EAZ45_04310 [Oscillatoriales cyanobacterium]TAG15445.1 MAG: hypothetical protein EAZ39_20645 [Oscillatoriales cyanobacterium]TAG43827.1 MAG: hypothetical protein EAZ33_11770 [Oscillatoriales cyanobacterium]TAG59800.1 MAG: hypothetical protein EAZ28_09930 [Oscillatoriales cyanobacterium]